MVVNNRPLKRIRRRVTADLPDFFTFPAPHDAVPSTPFRSSVRCFIQKHARLIFPFSPFSSLATWQILFRVGDGHHNVVALDIVEEDVTRSKSRSVYCDQCRIVGWSGHPVCRKRYHFIIQRNNNDVLIMRQTKQQLEGDIECHGTCIVCGDLLLDSRCKSCNSVTTPDDVENLVYRRFGDTTHLLHGVVHSNGYGHLLTLNGREGGSTILCGRDIMNFWDNLCKTLAVRKVSVMDVSKKYGIEYRLLHAVTYGHSWYGDWGYQFGSGSYALTLDDYQKAIETLANIPLSSLFSNRNRTPPTPQLQAVITFYQSISDSELVSLKDLLSFILSLIHQSHDRFMENQTRKKLKCTSTSLLRAWTRNDVERVEQAMIKVLLAATGGDGGGGESSWVSSRALKGALCKSTSLELLHYCLQNLQGKMASNGMVVNARFKASPSAVEFRLEPFKFVHNQAGSNSNYPSEEHLIHDLKLLYDLVLHPGTMLGSKPQGKRQIVIDSTTKLLDCKQFVKDYKPDHKMQANNPPAIYLWCHVEVADNSKDDPAPPPPPELIILPQNASVADLKLEATKAFQQVYALFKRFEIDELLDFGPLHSSMTLKLLVGSVGLVRVKGRFLGAHRLRRFQMEKGIEKWTVDCACGANDDDGEPMLACDTCGIWQHIRCVGINNNDVQEIPSKFFCSRCLVSCREAPDEVAWPNEAKMVVPLSKSCRDEAAETNTVKLQSGLRIPLM